MPSAELIASLCFPAPAGRLPVTKSGELISETGMGNSRPRKLDVLTRLVSTLNVCFV